MLKEQVAKIIQQDREFADIQLGEYKPFIFYKTDRKETVNKILNLFKAEVDKLTVIEICPYKLTNTELLEKKRGGMPATLVKRNIYLEGVQHTKKQLLDLMGV